MAAKLFLKHLFTSIKRRPVQPVLLILVIMLAVAAGIVSFDIKTYLLENNEQETLASIGYADYIVSVNSFSETRFILAEKGDTVPKGVDMCGLYGLPLTYGADRDFIYGAATDFETVNSLFNIELIASRPVYRHQQNCSIFITKDFAENYSVGIGDKITLELMGNSIPYTVCGISPRKFMGAYTVLFDSSSIVDSFIQNSITTTTMEGSFIPASALYIRSNGIIEKEYLQNKFPDMTISDRETMFSSTALEPLDIISAIIKVSSLLFVIMVIYCCFHILSAQRQGETALFYNVGAKKYLLNIFSSLEMFLYWILGGIAGTFLSLAIGNLFPLLGNLSYCDVKLHADAVCLSLLFVLLASQASLFIVLLSEQRQKKKVKQQSKKETIFTIILIVLSLLLVLICYLIPIAYKAPFGLAGIACMGVSSFLVSRLLVTNFAKLFAKRKKLSPTFLYALKNMGKVKTLGNTAGLVALFFAIVLMLGLLLLASEIGIAVDKMYIKGDYIVLNVNENAREILVSTEGVEKVNALFRDNVFIDGEEIVILAISDRSTIYDSCSIDSTPKGKECYLNASFAGKHNIEVGDEITFYLGNKKIEVECVQTVKSSSMFVMVDATYWDIPMSAYTIIGKEDIDGEILLSNIMTSLTGQSATFIETEQFVKDWMDAIITYILCIEITSAFIVLFSLTGMTDNIVSSYRSRREEFECFMAAGMNKRNLRKLKANEIFFSLLIGFVVFLFFAGFIFIAVDRSLLSYGMSLVWGLKETWFF